ncbi:hypothetical protein Q2E61_10370 [Microbulbifer thermotolerans]|uniref:hypothetical protein n=1 Tax=Microbulbifer thermotolerans TaxID=252514 RepID=UPI0026737D0A|nr:hypothetical protein [Microbulbifer thermotolerans]WKT59319.1 hypothetical protein Q2E61_10370 [Microbulbifer thermotolerans]
MLAFKTERAQILHTEELPIERKVCQAASDYKHALQCPEFAAANGCTADDLRHDLFVFVVQSERESLDAVSAQPSLAPHTE